MALLTCGSILTNFTMLIQLISIANIWFTSRVVWINLLIIIFTTQTLHFIILIACFAVIVTLFWANSFIWGRKSIGVSRITLKTLHIGASATRAVMFISDALSTWSAIFSICFQVRNFPIPCFALSTKSGIYRLSTNITLRRALTALTIAINNIPQGTLFTSVGGLCSIVLQTPRNRSRAHCLTVLRWRSSTEAWFALHTVRSWLARALGATRSTNLTFVVCYIQELIFRSTVTLFLYVVENQSKNSVGLATETLILGRPEASLTNMPAIAAFITFDSIPLKRTLELSCKNFALIFFYARNTVWVRLELHISSLAHMAYVACSLVAMQTSFRTRLAASFTHI